MKRFVLAAALLAASILPVAAQAVCGPHDIIVEGLLSTFGEKLQATAVAVDGPNEVPVEIYRAADTGTWTILLVKDNVACIAATGEAFKLVFATPSI